jgi:molecular chaperone GrpE
VNRRNDSEKNPHLATDEAADPKNDPPAGEENSSPLETAVNQEIERLVAEKLDLRNTLQRLQADFDNYRKRVDRERHQERHRGAETLIEHLLPVLDGFDRAIAAHRDAAHDEFRKGVQLIRKQLFDVLAKQGLEKIETEGKPFDPHFHHAIEHVKTTQKPDGAVLEELQSGYIFHGKVLRPAMVRVASNPEGEEAASNSRAN